MFLLDDVVVISASDLTVAAHCEFAALRKLDALLRRAELEVVDDAMLERTARLGDAHEARRLEVYRASFGAFDVVRGRGVVEIERPPMERYRDAAVLRAKHAETLAALRDGADVVFQGGFFDGRFHGWSDFLVREDDGSYSVHDTKLARHAKVTAVLQLAAYGDQLLREDIRVSPDAHLVLGDHSVTSHRLADVVPLYRHRRDRLLEILDRHQAGDDAATWDDGLHSACGRCDACQAEATARRDVLLVAGMRTDQRARLARAGIASIDALAAHAGDVPGMAARTLDRLRAQARMQVVQAPASGETGPVVAEVFAPEVIRALPPADPGDIFFDFEGDPLWSDGDPAHWGLEYLFGWVDVPATGDATPPFHALWAHDRAGERAALEAFVDHVTERRADHPGMHVYHYAPYETTALKRLVGRHGTREQELDALLRAGVFVDLYSTVRQSLRVSQPSYSIKKLEPLYMTAREGLDNAADSITDYALACEARDAGRPDESAALLRRIADYNADDCRSTYLLREWLVAQAAGLPATPPSSAVADDDERTPAASTVALRALAARLVAEADARATDGTTPDADVRSYRLLAAALEYWKREEKPAWWAHFARLTQPPDEWTDTRNVVRATRCEQVADWAKPARGNLRRTLQVTGELEAGTDIGVGSKVWTLYDGPDPSRSAGAGAGRTWNGSGAVVTDVEYRADCAVLTLGEVLPTGGTPWDDLPSALVPPVDQMPSAPQDAVMRLAERVLAEGELPPSPALDLLRRVPPRGLVAGDAIAAERETADVICDALRAADHTYLAVQGPPGTGKTFTGSRVIKRLVAEGWRIGVVAQSHAVVENMLRGVVDAGVEPSRVGKKASGGGGAVPWVVLDGAATWTAHLAQGGCVVGGTAWDFTNASRVPPESLDLLVVDEAGQFSLAATLAVSTAATRLLLLGDPRQLPQVSQGVHPEPVDESGLGWLMVGAPTLPPSLGVFLAASWRMHPELCAAVSELSYDGRLHAVPGAADRAVDGLAPGVHTVLVEHHGNRTVSPEERDVVVDLVRDLVGRSYRDGTAAPRPLGPDDVIVVAAYNAQVAALRAALDAAGLAETQVGTVDKFQGREAVVAVVSLAASSAADVPRGIEFLLDRNRLNVAVSRGKVAAYLVHSPRLRDHLPASVDALAVQGAFVGLSARGTGHHNGTGPGTRYGTPEVARPAT